MILIPLIVIAITLYCWRKNVKNKALDEPRDELFWSKENSRKLMAEAMGEIYEEPKSIYNDFSYEWDPNYDPDNEYGGLLDGGRYPNHFNTGAGQYYGQYKGRRVYSRKPYR